MLFSGCQLSSKIYSKYFNMAIIKRSNQPKYCLYVMELINTGHFYIGVTSDFASRKKNHLSAVDCFLHTLRLNWRRKEKFEYNQSRHQRVHSKFAEIIFKSQKNKYTPDIWLLKNYISFRIIDTVYTLDDACLLEGFLLGLFENSELCENVHLHSNYYRYARKFNKEIQGK